MKKEVKYVISFKEEGLSTTTIGGMDFPKGSQEAKRCNDIIGILEEYSTRGDKAKPLSVAVFGPPGSGKSRCVKEIGKTLGAKYLFCPVINLSQLSRAEDLAKAIEKSLPKQKDAIPIL